jgi:hypothetical protein
VGFWECDEQQLEDGGGQTKGKRGKVDFVEALPSEISLHILSFVPRSEVGASLPLVSRRWKRYPGIHTRAHTRMRGHSIAYPMWAGVC